jgi:hypothetical protein
MLIQAFTWYGHAILPTLGLKIRNRHAGRPGTHAINVKNINAIREARQASGKFVWMSPIVGPLILAFVALGALTYDQVNRSLAKTNRQHRPYGLLGPSVNEFLINPRHPKAPE